MSGRASKICSKDSPRCQIPRHKGYVENRQKSARSHGVRKRGGHDAGLVPLGRVVTVSNIVHIKNGAN